MNAAAWKEQRDFVDLALEALGSHPLAAKASAVTERSLSLSNLVRNPICLLLNNSCPRVVYTYAYSLSMDRSNQP